MLHVFVVAAVGIKLCLNASEEVAGRSGTEEAHPPNQLHPVNEEGKIYQPTGDSKMLFFFPDASPMIPFDIASVPPSLV